MGLSGAYDDVVLHSGKFFILILAEFRDIIMVFNRNP